MSTPAAAVPDAVVEGARRALELHGAGGITLERIAAEAGVSRMTLHRRGVSKDDILAALALRLEAEYRDAGWQALLADGSARDRLRRALELECHVAESNLELLDALSTAARDEIFHERDGRRLTRPVFVEPLQKLLREGAEDGSLEPVEVDETATVLFNLVGHTYRHLRAGHGWSATRARAAVVRIAMDGVAAR
ncbi:MAG TPA: TetR family transcriptional regulator [Thermoleophilaceae bacterium]